MTNSMEVEVIGRFSDLPTLQTADCNPDDPFVYYDRAGDFVEFFVKREPYCSEFLSDYLTVHVSRDSEKVIGAQLCGFRNILNRILRRAPGFQLEITNNEVSVGALFKACQWTDDGQLKAAVVDVYEKVREVAEKSGARVPIPA